MLLKTLISHGASLAGASDSADPYRTKSITHEFHLDRDGKARLVTHKEPVGLQMPYLRDRKTGVTLDPLYCHDTAEYVLGFAPEKLKRILPADYRRSFWDAQLTLAQEAGDQALVYALEVEMADDFDLTMRELFENVEESSELIALFLDGQPIAHRPRIEAHLRKTLSEAMNAKGDEPCLLCGKPCDPVRLHTKISGVPGTGLPAALLNFQSETSRFNGHEQGNNFPTCAACVRLYANGLQDLLRNHKSTIETQPYGLCVLVWGAPGTEHFPKVIEPFYTSEERRVAWEAIEGLRNCSDMLHIVCLRGTKGRIAILSYNQCPAHDVVSGLLLFRDIWSWSKDLPNNQFPEALWGRGIEAWPSVRGTFSRLSARGSPIDSITQLEVIRRLLLWKEGEGFSESFVRSLVSAILPKSDTTSYHVRVALKWVEMHDYAVNKRRKPILIVGGKGMPEKGLDLEPKLEEYVLPLSTIRGDQMPTDSEPTVEKFVEAENDDPHYVLGRLISLADFIRRKASGRSVPSKAREMLHRAMTNPCAVFSDLIRNTKIYEDRTSGEDHQSVRDLCQAIRTEQFNPRPMSDQARFRLTLGYEHQEAFRWAVINFQRNKRKKSEPNEVDSAAAE